MFCMWAGGTLSWAAWGWKDCPVQTKAVPMVSLFPKCSMGPTHHQRRSQCPSWEHDASTFPPCCFSQFIHRRTHDTLSGTVCARAEGGFSTPGSVPSHSNAEMTSTHVPAPGVTSGHLHEDSASTHALPSALSPPHPPTPRALEEKHT